MTLLNGDAGGNIQTRCAQLINGAAAVEDDMAVP